MLRPGQRIDRYTLVKRIGAGGFGEVWSVVADNVPGEYALKLLHSSIQEEPGRGPTIVDRFLSEARTLMRLDHAGIVRVIDIVDDRPAALGYVMEKLDGLPLNALKLDDLGTLLGIFRRVAEALDYVHERGLFHRDVKPANIIVGRPAADGRSFVKLIDFGIAKDRFESHESTGMGMLVGTLRGTAPESIDRLNGRPVQLTGAIDQWGLGVTMFRTFSGHPPFDGDSMLALMEAIKHQPPALLTYRRELDTDIIEDDLTDIVLRMLRKHPGDRFPSMKAVAEALGELEHHLVSGSTLVSPASRLAPTGPSISIPFAIDVDVEALFSDDSRTSDDDDDATGVAASDIVDRVSLDRPLSPAELDTDEHLAMAAEPLPVGASAADWSSDVLARTELPPDTLGSGLVAPPLPSLADLGEVPYDLLPQASRSRTEPMEFPALIGMRPTSIRVEPVDAPTERGAPPAYRGVVPSAPLRPNGGAVAHRQTSSTPSPPPAPSPDPASTPSAAMTPPPPRHMSEASSLRALYWVVGALLVVVVGTAGFLAGRYL